MWARVGHGPSLAGFLGGGRSPGPASCTDPPRGELRSLANQEDRILTTKPKHNVREKIRGWVGDFCEADAMKSAAPDASREQRDEAQEALTLFLVAACANQGRELGELTQEDLDVAFLESLAPQDLDSDLHALMPSAVAGLLAHLEDQGHLKDGRKLGAALAARASEYTDVATAKPVPIKNTETKLGRNDKCSCGSGKKYKKCCLNKS